MMEVDLLNAGGKELGDLAEEESSGRCDDAEFSVGSTVLWPLLDNASPLQHFMPFKTQQEQKFKNFLFNLIPATEFQHISQKAHINQGMNINHQPSGSDALKNTPLLGSKGK
ncbi:uncharacterized protein LOC110027205 isoform X3 [Phalaenopsis equestris]|uniref:uncharacterized protein LOC110027205 isoform X3 n=1 Tax=Phalaenopsis equestris TaxID=78828 RepID=UPI0009E464F6|nr:uncharacterized protein LOC110027205 isoform X3 [Phalaenopsis equestris]